MLSATRDKKTSTQNRAPLDLDGLYPAEEIAPWMRLTKNTVLQLAREGKIPVVSYNERVLRFHPRTILAKGLRTLPI
jgi:hypothetical protein